MDKFIVIAVLTVTLYQSQSIDAFGDITFWKNYLRTISRGLEFFINDSIPITNAEFTNFKIDRENLVIPILNSSYNDTYITIAADNNTNADHCLDLMEKELSEVKKKALAKFDQCIDDEAASLGAAENAIKAHIKKGKRLVSQLEGIAVSCNRYNETQAQVCVVRGTILVEVLTNNYKANLEHFKNARISLSNSVQASMMLCSQPPINDLYFDTSAVKISAEKCMQKP